MADNPGTDADLNRAVAEARGWTNIHTDHDGILVGTQPGSIHAFWVPDVVLEWGALHDELRAAGWRIEMTSGATLTTVKVLRWEPGARKQTGEAADALTGRALALAFLQAIKTKE